MKINKLDNNSTVFMSKLRIQPDLMYHISKNSTLEESLLKKIKRLEKNGNDDIVVLSLNTIEKDFDYFDYLRMDVFEMRANKFYTNESVIEKPLMVENFYNTKYKKINLDRMYNEAKGKMTKLVKKMNKYMPYI